MSRLISDLEVEDLMNRVVELEPAEADGGIWDLSCFSSISRFSGIKPELLSINYKHRTRYYVMILSIFHDF